MLRQQRVIDPRERRPARNRDQRLLADRLAAGFDAALIVALAGPTEAGLEQVVRGQRGEPRRQRPRAADQDPHDGRPQIVVRHARRHAVEVRKRADVPVEKADLILALVDPREVAARGTSAASGRATPCGGSRRGRPAPRRSRPPPRSPGRYVNGTKTSRRCRFHSATASLTTVTPTVCPSATSSPCSRVAVSRCLPPVHCADSASSACTRAATLSQTGRGRGPASAFRTGTAWPTYLPTVVRDSPNSRATAPLRPSLDEHFVPNYMHLIHPEHPLSGPRIPRSGKPAIRPSGGLLSERRMAYFLSGAPSPPRRHPSRDRVEVTLTRARGSEHRARPAVIRTRDNACRARFVQLAFDRPAFGWRSPSFRVLSPGC